MKNKVTNIILTLITILFFSCDEKPKGKLLVINEVINPTSEFIITKDTLDFSINGYLKKVVLFKNKFYCMFETNRENTGYSYKKMVILNEQGKFIEDVFIPSGIQSMNYYDLIIENDSIYVKRGQFDEENFLLGKYVADFQKVNTKKFVEYEDDKYKIYSTCRGEWGGTIFFENKITKDLYEGSSTCAIIVNKIENDYYITNYMGHMIGFSSVLRINNPENLEKSDWDYKKRFGSRNHKGIEVLMDTTDFYIPTSFVKNKKLFHLYSDDDGTYIGKIENKKMKSVYKFDFKFYSHFNQQMKDGKQILTFHIPETNKNGILIIDDNGLKFRYLK